VGKKKRGQRDEPLEPSALDRMLQDRSVRIMLGAAVLVAFAVAAILVVTVLGGSGLSKSDEAAKPPPPIGPGPQLERSAAADLLGGKSWDDMTEEERALIKTEVTRVFDQATFRATNQTIVAIDVFRKDGLTQVSRQYLRVEAQDGKQSLAQQVLFFCVQPDGTPQPYRYLLSALQNDFAAAEASKYPRPWDRITADIDWSSVTDLGFDDVNGRRVHGLEVHYIFGGVEGAVPTTGERRSRYWFDVETAQLLRRGQVIAEDTKTEDQAVYTLDHSELPAIVLPDALEKPQCVQDILAKVAS
jgi:hypothetical protein